MRKFKIQLSVVSSAAAKSGKSMENYVSDLATLSFGHEVCAHFEGVDKSGIATFYFT